MKLHMPKSGTQIFQGLLKSWPISRTTQGSVYGLDMFGPEPSPWSFFSTAQISSSSGQIRIDDDRCDFFPLLHKPPILHLFLLESHIRGGVQHYSNLPKVRQVKSYKKSDKLVFYYSDSGILCGLRYSRNKYPLVICCIAIEHGHRNSWFTH